MKQLLLALSVLALCACGGAPQTVDVLAQRAEFKAVSPEYLGYVDADPSFAITDPTLTDAQRAERIEQKKTRHDTVSVWDLRIRALEAALKEAQK